MKQSDVGGNLGEKPRGITRICSANLLNKGAPAAWNCRCSDLLCVEVKPKSDMRREGAPKSCCTEVMLWKPDSEWSSSKLHWFLICGVTIICSRAKQPSYKKTNEAIGRELQLRFTDSPCVTLNHWQPGPHAQNSRSNNPAWWRWTWPWLSRATHAHTHTNAHTRSLLLLFTGAYHIAKLEKPWQNMAYRLHTPWDWSFSFWWVLISALWPFVPSSFAPALFHRPHMSFGWPDWCLQKRSFTLNGSPRRRATRPLCNSPMAGTATLAVAYLTQETGSSLPRFT